MNIPVVVTYSPFTMTFPHLNTELGTDRISLGHKHLQYVYHRFEFYGEVEAVMKRPRDGQVYHNEAEMTEMETKMEMEGEQGLM